MCLPGIVLSSMDVRFSAFMTLDLFTKDGWRFVAILWMGRLTSLAWGGVPVLSFPPIYLLVIGCRQVDRGEYRSRFSCRRVPPMTGAVLWFSESVSIPNYSASSSSPSSFFFSFFSSVFLGVIRPGTGTDLIERSVRRLLIPLPGAQTSRHSTTTPYSIRFCGRLRPQATLHRSCGKLTTAFKSVF
ncbi:hypothetical protein QC763_105003 [Podospora pseudopauciseta]|uniref:Uncharacterized protein n=1 Tax=Podospora pseudopauciseta TaxID=2093780 RepID=A0ABR0HXR5_9PEZI|nr:hypothetical protein QC763_105003 [Podospora pseudopauciseta]